MNGRNRVKLLVVLVLVLSVAAAGGAVMASLAHPPRHGSVKPRVHVTAPRTGIRGQSRPFRPAGAGGSDIAAHVNLNAIAGALTCFAILACWGWWQTHHRCPSCGYCPAWCRCGEAAYRHSPRH